MQTPPLQKQVRLNTGEWSPPGGTPRYTSRSGTLPPSNPTAMAARLFVPVFAAAAAWSSLWIGPFYSAVLAIWTCWAVTAIARKVSTSGPERLKQAAYGERIWLNQLSQQARPLLGGRLPVLYFSAWTGLIVAVLGGIFASPIVTGTGLLVSVIAHLVCFQHLAEFYLTQKNEHPLYRFWEAEPANDDGGRNSQPIETTGSDNLARKRQRPSVR